MSQSQSSLLFSNPSSLFGNQNSRVDKNELFNRVLKNGDYLNIKNEETKKERLKEVLKALQMVEQTNSPPWNKNLLKHLVDRKLLLNSDPEISIYSASAVAEILRIIAPDHPFTQNQIHLIFTSFFHQFSLFNDVEGELFTHLYLLLETITTVNLFSIVAESVPKLVDNYIDTVYGVIAGKDEFFIQVEKYFADNIILLFEDTEVEVDTLKKVLTPLVSYSKNEPGTKVAYQLSATVLNNTIEHILSPLSTHINSELLQLKKQKGKTSKKDKGKKGKLFHTILQLNNINTKLLLYIMPNICEQIVDENIEIRMPAVQLLGKMFVSRESFLHRDYPQIFEGEFLSRFSDIDPNIRLIMSKFAGLMVLNHNSTKDIINIKLSERLRDPDERVRKQIVDTVCDIAMKDDNLVSVPLMKEVSSRCRDKRTPLRLHTMNRVANLYRHAKQLELSTEKPWTEDQQEKFEWIPSSIIQYSISMEDPGHRMFTEILFYDDLLPSDSSLRTQTLFDIYSNMNESDRRLFEKLVARKAAFRNGIRNLIANEDPNRKLQLISTLTDHLPEKKIGKLFWKNYSTFSEEVHTFVKEIIDTISSYNNVASLKNKLKEITSLSKDDHLYLDYILKRCSMNLLTQEQLVVLFNWIISIYEEEEANRDTKKVYDCLSFILYFAENFPELINEQCRTSLATLLEKGDTQVNTICLKILQHSPISKNERVAWKQSEKNFEDLLLRFLYKESSSEARYASKCISSLFGARAELIFEEIFSKITKDLHYDTNTLPCVLTTIAFIAKKYPSIYQNKALSILDFVIDDVIMINRGETKSSFFAKPSYEVKTKIAGINLLVSHLDYLSTSADASEIEIDSERIISILFDILVVQGETTLLDTDRTGYSVRLDKISQAHIRLNTAIALIRIACRSRFLPLIAKTNRLCLLASLSRDDNVHVREDFATSLMKYLSKMKLSNKFYALLLLFVGDEDNHVAQTVRRFVSIVFKSLRSTLISTGPYNLESKEAPILYPEYILPTLILLLSRWPTFDDLYPQFYPFQRILFAYFDEVTQDFDNYSFFLQLLRKIKQRRDADNMESNNSLIICDMCLSILNNCAENRSFSTLPFPGKIFIPPFFASVHHSTQDKEMDFRTLFLPYDFKLSTKSARSFSPKKQSKKQAGNRSPTHVMDESDDESASVTQNISKRNRVESTPFSRKRRKVANSPEETSEDEMRSRSPSPPKSTKKRNRRALVK